MAAAIEDLKLGDSWLRAQGFHHFSFGDLLLAKPPRLGGGSPLERS
jgi:hypothetical protein